MATGVGKEPVPAPGLPRISSGCIHPTAPHAGTQFVQGGDGGRRFDEVYGNGWRLVVLGADVECIGRNECAWFESIGGRAVSLVEPDPHLSAGSPSTTRRVRSSDRTFTSTERRRRSRKRARCWPTSVITLRRSSPHDARRPVGRVADVLDARIADGRGGAHFAIDVRSPARSWVAAQAAAGAWHPVQLRRVIGPR